MQEIHSLYIHFPFCVHLCNYCDFYKLKLKEEKEIRDFEVKLEKNIKKHDEFLSENNCKISKLKTIYVGGGTPSLWGEEGALFFKEKLLSKYLVDEKLEFTLEVDPNNWTPASLEAWRNIGVNRFSVGAQSYDNEMLNVLDRNHTESDIAELLEYLQKEKLNFSVDILIGVPNSNENNRNLEKEIESFMHYKPSHFSVYVLTTRSNYAYKDKMPLDSIVEKEYTAVCSYLKKLGFMHYEVSNYALDGKMSEHNLAYWKSQSVAALGANGTGFFNFNTHATRYKYQAVGNEYFVEQINQNELLLEEIYLGLRSCVGYDFAELGFDKVKDTLDRWFKIGYIDSIEGSVVKLSSKGFLMLDSLMGDLFILDLF